MTTSPTTILQPPPRLQDMRCYKNCSQACSHNWMTTSLTTIFATDYKYDCLTDYMTCSHFAITIMMEREVWKYHGGWHNIMGAKPWCYAREGEISRAPMIFHLPGEISWRRFHMPHRANLVEDSNRKNLH